MLEDKLPNQGMLEGSPDTGVLEDKLPTTRYNQPVRQSANGGYTLIELLTTVGIISVLVGVTLPALSGARRVTNDIGCAADMRSIGQATMMYTDDNRGYIPSNNPEESGGTYTGSSTARVRGPPGYEIGIGKLFQHNYLPESSVGILGSWDHSKYTQQEVENEWESDGTVDSARLYRESGYGFDKLLDRNPSNMAVVMDNATTSPTAGYAHNHRLVHIGKVDGSITSGTNKEGLEAPFTHAGAGTQTQYAWENADNQ